MSKFKAGHRVKINMAAEAARGFISRHPRLTGPFLVRGTHPKGENDQGQLVCIQLSEGPGDVVVVEAQILQLA
ncbi:hypothetical protein KKH39_01345 [Patescibacteria group bacterium]|nr:hypothetical protein [Patescibacteria group bacterium]